MTKQEREQIREDIDDWSKDGNIFRAYCEKLLDSLDAANEKINMNKAVIEELKTRCEGYSDLLCTEEAYTKELKQNAKKLRKLYKN